jgi:hypothetical protein
MKHPFFTLYYTGIGIIISAGLILSLLVLNISNITQAFSGDNPSPKPYSGSTDVKVLQDLPVEKENEVVITKSKQQTQQAQKETLTNTVQKSNEKITTALDTAGNEKILQSSDSSKLPPLKP